MLETKDLRLAQCEIKFAQDRPRTFSGYASVWGGVDYFGDTIAPGAYAKSLTQPSLPPMLFSHDPEKVIGKWTVAREDARGLYVEGELTPGHSVADDAHASLQHGALTGLSIGYKAHKFERTKTGRLLKEIELVEISLVAFPADAAARIARVKSMKASEVRRVLRDHFGLSEAQAERYHAAGMKAIESTPLEAAKTLLQRIRA